MSWTRFLRYWHRRDESPPTTDVGQDIDEELMFHLRSLVDEELAKGTSFDAAWCAAQDRFGSLPHYAGACRDITLEDRLMWQRFSIAGFVVLGMLVGWLALEVRTLRQGQVSLLAANLAKSAAMEKLVQKPSDERHAITGQVLDQNGQPIDSARLLVILKTWPNDRYRQDDFSTITDERGRFRLPNLVPSQGQYAILVAAVKSGYALTSNYHLQPEGEHRSVDPVTLHCERASPITLILRDDQGRPAAHARVAPSSRQAADGTSHLIYFQNCAAVQTASDADGRVHLGCFQRGDMAQIYLQLPGKDWQSCAFAIPKEGDTVEVSAARSADAGEKPDPNTKS
jgi:hypothetical protein